MSKYFELDVLVHGSAARVYKHEGKAYIEGKVGSTFTVRIKNNSPWRALAVLTVDGLSVMDGSEASFDSGGYIIPAWGSVKVPGWRLSDDNVASFEFTIPGNSYAASKGKGTNLGVIGCAFYFEQKPNTDFFNPKTKEFERGESPQYRLTTSSSSGDIRFMSLSMNDSNNTVNCYNMSSAGLGTGFGDKKSHKVESKNFERATVAPIEIATLYYDTLDGLKRRGVDVDYRLQVSPSPFPKESAYCEPPKGWSDK